MQNSFLSALGLTWSSSELTASFPTQERKYYCLIASCLGLKTQCEFDNLFLAATATTAIAVPYSVIPGTCAALTRLD